MCNIRFKMSGIDTYKLCAKVTVFDLECERRGDGRRLLQFYWGIAMKQKVGNVFISHRKIRVFIMTNLFLNKCDGRWFSLGSPVSSTNQTDRHDITEIVLKVALSTINRTQT